MTDETKERIKLVGSRIADLINVKSIVTLALTGTLVALMFTDVSPTKELLALFCTSYGAITTYFFTRKGE